MVNNNISILDGQIKCTIKNNQTKSRYNNTVAFCVDDGYLSYALFAAQQIIIKHKSREFDICICLPDIAKVPEYFINLDIRFVEIEVTGIDSLPVDHLSLAAYNRLLLPQVFSNDYKYIVYLDADVYINRPFFNELMGVVNNFKDDFCIAAAPDITEINRRSRTKNAITPLISQYLKTYHEANHIYRNSGVLVFNVSNYIRQNSIENIFSIAFSTQANLRYHDQSAINLAMKGNMPLLPFEYNWQLHEINYRLIRKLNPYIIHFIGTNKPWINSYVHTKPYIREYEDFLKLYFKNCLQPLKTPAQIRLQKPKYQNIYREAFSRNMAFLKQPISNNIKDAKFRIYRNVNVEKAIKEINNNVLSSS